MPAFRTAWQRSRVVLASPFWELLSVTWTKTDKILQCIVCMFVQHFKQTSSNNNLVLKTSIINTINNVTMQATNSKDVSWFWEWSITFYLKALDHAVRNGSRQKYHRNRNNQKGYWTILINIFLMFTKLQTLFRNHCIFTFHYL